MLQVVILGSYGSGVGSTGAGADGLKCFRPERLADFPNAQNGIGPGRGEQAVLLTKMLIFKVVIYPRMQIVIHKSPLQTDIDHQKK